MNRILPILVLLSLCMVSLQAAQVNATSFDVEQLSQGVTAMQFALPQWQLETEQADGQDYAKIVIDDAFTGFTQETGMPELPTFTSMVAIPFTGDVSLEIVSVQEELQPIGAIWPVQLDDQETFRQDQQYYATGAVYPAQQAELGAPAVLRDYRVVPVTINPFRYDPVSGQMHVITGMQVRVVAQPGPMHPRATVSRSFEPFYRTFISNYDAIRDVEEEYQPRNMIVVHNGNTQIEPQVEQFMEWKRDKGFDVYELDTTTVGSTSSAIKNYIQNAYDNWEYPPEYIVLIGDVGGSFGVPTWYSSGTYGEGDHPYSMLDGPDLLPEAFVGRISVETQQQLITWLAKMNLVERQPYTGNPNYYHHSLLVGDTSPSGLSTILTNKYIKETIHDYDPEHTFDEMYSGNPSPEQMVNYMNNGTLFFDYRGYLGMSGFTASHANSMANYDMPVNAVINTCGTGPFAGSSNTEALMRAGTPSDPTGAHSAIGMSTSGTHTQFNNVLSGGTFYGLYPGNMHTMGEAIMCGKVFFWMAYYNTVPSTVSDFIYWNNLMGDPSLDVWRTEPIDIEATHDTNIPLGQGWLDIYVEDETSMPVDGAWVCARNDDETILVRGYTDEDGLLTLRFDPQVSGDVSLVITRPDYMPKLHSFTVGTTGGVSFTELSVTDDGSGSSQGNGDGMVNPGEIIELGVNLHNYTSATVSNITATLTTDCPYITITTNTESFGSIAAGATGTPDSNFLIEVADNAPDRLEALFYMDVTASAQSWDSRFWLPISGVDLDVDDAWVEDGGNGVLDPGETATFKMTLANNGQVGLDGVTATLVSLNSLVRVDDAEATFGYIAQGSTGTCNDDTFEISGLGLMLPGMLIPFELLLSNGDGYEETEYFQLEVGVVTVNDPLGPDNGGYVAYDIGDTGYIDCPEYEWIEIKPSQGGPGTQLPISDVWEEDDDIVFLEMPFTFMFYGTEYDTIGVCSNGFVTFDHSEQMTFRNWVIPGPMGPSPMIAVFWDELYTDDGVFAWFDADHHKYVITWDCVNSVGGASEEFQLILFDPQYYLSSTFDGPIKMQYKEFNNVDSNCSSGGPQGNYCTIGLEDPTETIGLQYSYDDMYPTACAELGNETAIYFTGKPVSFEESYLIMGEVAVHDGDGSGIIDAGEAVDLGIYLENVGLSTSENTHATISTNDDYVILNEATASYGNIGSNLQGVNQTYFNFSVLPSCPNGHFIEFGIHCVDDNDSWDYTFTLVAYKPQLKMGASLIWDADGNNDGIMDPGESGLLVINVDNTSETYARNVVATLSSNSTAITLLDTEQTYPDIAPGDNAQRTFAYQVSQDATVGESVTFTLEVECTGAQEASWGFQSSVGIWGWSTDFESGDEGFVGEGEWAYGIPTIDVHSGQYAWGTDLIVFYDNNADQSLYTNEYYIGASSQLIFWHDYRTEFNHDGCNVKISIDGGSTWHLLYPQCGYNGTASSTNSGIANEPCFTGYSPGFAEVVYDLGDYANNYAILRFHFGSDGATVAYGWTIDDVTITGSQDKACKLTGTLTVDNEDIAMADTRVSTGESTTVPEDDGAWELFTAAGTFNLVGSAMYCERDTEVNVLAEQGVVSPNHELALTYLLPPYDLDAELDVNSLTLSWNFDGDLPTTATRRNGTRNRAVLEEFRVWQRIETGEVNMVASSITDTVWTCQIDSLKTYNYWVDAVYDAGSTETTLEVSVYWDGSGVNAGPNEVPAFTELQGNYPNPFNPETTVRFSMAEAGNVELTVYNVRGQRVRTLLREPRDAGQHEIVWHGRNDSGQAVGSGVYFVRMVAPGCHETRKMLLLK